MAGVICDVCGCENAGGATECAVCGNPLSLPRPPPETTPDPAPDRPPDPTPDDSALRCPACAALVPNPANRVCVECLEPLTPPDPAGPAASGPRLLFPGHRVDVPAPGTVLLGRDPDQSPVAGYFAAHDNVSRRHASVGAEPDGSMWVRDEYSANGTFVNDTRVPAGATVPLADGDRLRLASDVVARTELGRSL